MVADRVLTEEVEEHPALVSAGPGRRPEPRRQHNAAQLARFPAAALS